MELIVLLTLIIVSAIIISVVAACCCKKYQEGRVLGPAPETNVYVTETALVQPVHPGNVTYVSMHQPGVAITTTQAVVGTSGPPSIGWQHPPPYSQTYPDETQQTTGYYVKQPAHNPNY